MKLNGVTIQEAADYLQTSIATLERVYLGTTDDYMRRAAAAI
jgi:hypothetical protein